MMGMRHIHAAAWWLLLVGCSSGSSTDPSDESDSDAGGCPAVASACPKECFAISGSPIDGDCHSSGVVVGCYARAPEVLTQDIACARRVTDGAEFQFTSGTLAGLLLTSSSWEPCGTSGGYVPPCGGPF